MQKVREYSSGHKIRISMNKTIDAESQYVANVIIGILEAEQTGKKVFFKI